MRFLSGIVIAISQVVLFSSAAYAQLGDTAQLNTTKAYSLAAAFKKAKAFGRARYFFMSTINQGGLSDYYANAVGGQFKMETARLYNFQAGAGGAFVYNIGSSNLVTPDKLSGAGNRYELALFDITNPAAKKMYRLEELYLKYNLKRGFITLGKQFINTPFINIPDGRMRITAVDGLYSKFVLKKYVLEGGLVYGISPRSTYSWYDPGKSVGTYGVGVNPDGTPSGYRKSIHSKYILLSRIQMSPLKNVQLYFTEQYADNMLNLAHIQADYRHYIFTDAGLLAAVQFTREDAVGNGGNPDPAKAYILPGSRSMVVSARLGLETERSVLYLNYTRVNAQGRFLMPREWGKEPFFTFMPRERIEGCGDINAYTISGSRSMLNKKMACTLTAGYFSLPAVTNLRLNKYGMPSYAQFNADVRYRFVKALDGLELGFLYVYKMATHKGNPLPYRSIINKVGMSNINLIVDYHF